MIWVFLWMLWTGEAGIARHSSLESCEAAREAFLLEHLTDPELPLNALIHAGPCRLEEEA